ncbi:MAG: transporter substrate-binding domain-containing protein [Desulfobacteraceae bacterium]|jgi:membrane-bound lytic murein transglycosylase MltF
MKTFKYIPGIRRCRSHPEKWLMVIIPIMAMLLPSYSSGQDIPLLHVKGIKWTDQEVQFIQALHKKGSISVASEISYSVYEPQADGTIRGFHYHVIDEFSKLVDIRVNVLTVHWNDYFLKKGESVDRVKTDPNYTYSPELLDKVDLYVEGITALPWREQLFDIIKFVPSRQLLVIRKDERISNYADLNNKTCVMVKNTSMEFNLEKTREKHHIQFDYIYVDDFDLMDQMVSQKKADFTVFDAVRAFVAIYEYKNLKIGMPVSEIEMLGWGIHKKNTILKSIIAKYLNYAQTQGIFDKYWKQDYGITFVEFLKVLDYR